MYRTRLFLFWMHVCKRRYDRPFAYVEVLDTGDESVDRKAAYKRFRKIYGWDADVICPVCNTK